MSLIKNLIKEPEKKSKKDDEDSDEEEKSVRPIIKSATDLQRLKIEKLMKNPEKPVQIPDYVSREAKRNREIEPPSFVRNVMGSSAGAGSGEFHVYRHLRRKEYARQKGIQIKSLTHQRDQEYQDKLEENRRIAEEKTAKKRAKRLKKKQRAKQAKKPKPNTQATSQEKEHDTTDDENSDDGNCDEKIGENGNKAAEHIAEVAEIESESNCDQAADSVVAGEDETLSKTLNVEEETSTLKEDDCQDDALQADLNKVD